MPYKTKKIGNKHCVYKKSDNSKVGCTTGNIKKYLAALHYNANENYSPLSCGENKEYSSHDLIKNLLREELNKLL
jgi:hypothetical protein